MEGVRHPNRYAAIASNVTIVSFNTHMRRGYRHAWVYDVSACYLACINHERCFGFDFDSLYNTCWLHDEQGSCSEMIEKTNCTTYRIIDCCECWFYKPFYRNKYSSSITNLYLFIYTFDFSSNNNNNNNNIIRSDNYNRRHHTS